MRYNKPLKSLIDLRAKIVKDFQIKRNKNEEEEVYFYGINKVLCKHKYRAYLRCF
ncbi:hypothetical protein M832_07890 [Chlamydia avium 10DC88]|uniref:Uncharacterized protein n=1 Tax=Chlamydia avium 10DC88 TaxID=1229831 RepID=W8JS24_9CHLA|nr:hypothetical protein M832_07890 [Chlamydia avium 10DC88]